jgi:hypothetical protein
MIMFKIMLLFQDLTDISAYLIQLKVIKADHLLADLRTRIGNLYFAECIGWLLYHSV